MARTLDSIDLMCMKWARTRREVMGLADPPLACQYLGAVRSTLEGVKATYDGTDSGQLKQHFPEVYVGRSFWVNRAFHNLPLLLRATFDVHYAAKGPTPDKAEALGIARSTYWARISQAKAFIDGYVMANEQD